MAGPSNCGAESVDVAPHIFLSHSGRQKNFVENLYNALRSANQTVFFDTHTLPKGSSFPHKIKQAARGCKLGVVVVSDDFFSSKWPMIELEILLLERGEDPKVLPLFYKLRPSDLKSSENLERWQATWKEAARDANRWEDAVRKLRSINGEQFIQGMSETAYIKKVVQRICKLVPCPVPYDMSLIQGHQRLAKVIARMFEDVEASQDSEGKACIVGLHGVGGLGKTTLSKCMVNFYTSEYLGRSCLVEFPTDGDKLRVAQECRKALEILTILSDEHVSKRANSFDQVVHLMKEHMNANDVFLAIDNVWENCQEEAERLLQVGFTAKSKILITSRSKQVLKNLLDRYTNAKFEISNLPTPAHQEALQIFRHYFGEAPDLTSLVRKTHMDRVLERCMFNDAYHSLALKALASYLRRGLGDFKNVEDDLSAILEEMNNSDLESVDKLLKLSYENLPQPKKDMFLDIVVFADMQNITRISLTDGSITRLGKSTTDYIETRRWLSDLDKRVRGSRKSCKARTEQLIQELALDGLIQIVEDRFRIEVHDLYMELGRSEAKNSPIFYITDSTRSVEDVEWEKLKKVFLSKDSYGGVDACVFDKLQQQKCGSLEVLHVDDIETSSGFCLDSMPSLRMLVLKKVQSAASGIDLKLNGVVQLRTLRIVECHSIKRVTGLDALQSLHTLHLEGCSCLVDLDGLSGSIFLETLTVESCESLQKIPDLSTLTCLEKLHLLNNKALKEVESFSSTLIDVYVEKCKCLKRLPNVEGLTKLKRMELRHNEALEEVVGKSFSTITAVSRYGCNNLTRLPKSTNFDIIDSLALKISQLTNAVIHKHTRHQI